MTIIQHRRGTAAEWTSENPVLNSGEIGYETDTAKFKFGDGSSTWEQEPCCLETREILVRWSLKKEVTHPCHTSKP